MLESHSTKNDYSNHIYKLCIEEITETCNCLAVLALLRIWVWKAEDFAFLVFLRRSQYFQLRIVELEDDL
jgi:hypothetical protein